MIYFSREEKSTGSVQEGRKIRRLLWGFKGAITAASPCTMVVKVVRKGKVGDIF